MKVSVIVPCYNAQAYLAQCLDSLRRQTMTDFEALLVDDGSDDQTPGILADAAAEDARLTVLRQDVISIIKNKLNAM